jgi:hypothetical protein
MHVPYRVHTVIATPSAEAAAIREYVNERKIILISQASTAFSLAIPDDYLFRLAPNDRLEGAAVAALTNWYSGERPHAKPGAACQQRGGRICSSDEIQRARGDAQRTDPRCSPRSKRATGRSFVAHRSCATCSATGA